jgi:hypothetical protein
MEEEKNKLTVAFRLFYPRRLLALFSWVNSRIIDVLDVQFVI